MYIISSLCRSCRTTVSALIKYRRVCPWVWVFRDRTRCCSSYVPVWRTWSSVSYSSPIRGHSELNVSTRWKWLMLQKRYLVICTSTGRPLATTESGGKEQRQKDIDIEKSSNI